MPYAKRRNNYSRPRSRSRPVKRYRAGYSSRGASSTAGLAKLAASIELLKGMQKSRQELLAEVEILKAQGDEKKN